MFILCVFYILLNLCLYFSIEREILSLNPKFLNIRRFNVQLYQIESKSTINIINSMTDRSRSRGRMTGYTPCRRSKKARQEGLKAKGVKTMENQQQGLSSISLMATATQKFSSTGSTQCSMGNSLSNHSNASDGSILFKRPLRHDYSSTNRPSPSYELPLLLEPPVGNDRSNDMAERHPRLPTNQPQTI